VPFVRHTDAFSGVGQRDTLPFIRRLQGKWPSPSWPRENPDPGAEGNVAIVQQAARR
jgi:hypothetical protein